VPDRIPSDHDAIESLRGTLEGVGRTDRPKVTLPTDAADRLPADEVVRVVIDGRTCHTRVQLDFDDQPELRGAFDSPTLARSPGDGTDRLAEWVADADVQFGGSVLVDVVAEGHTYGLRAPGTRTVYEAVDPPDEGLASIARDVEDG
jgi:hypothetical protein